MKLNNEKNVAVVDWIISSSPIFFWVKLLSGSSLLSLIIYGSLFWLVETLDMTNTLPADRVPWIIIIVLVIWVFVLLTLITAIFGLGGHFARVDVYDRGRALDELLASANKKIWLVGLSLLPFTEESRIRELKKAIVERNVNVRILIVSPESEIAITRNKELYNGDDTLIDDIHLSIKKFKSLLKSIEQQHRNKVANISIRTYKGNAPMSTFIIDDEARVGILLNQSTGLFAPEIKILNRGSQVSIYRAVIGHFDSVFNEAQNIEASSQVAK
jgi:hypothetical protein